MGWRERKFLENRSFNVRQQPREGASETLVSWAERHGKKDILMFLLNHGADVNFMFVFAPHFP